MGKVLSSDEIDRLLRGIDPDVEAAEKAARIPVPSPGDLCALTPESWCELMEHETPHTMALAFWTLTFEAAVEVLLVMPPAVRMEMLQALSSTKQPTSILHPDIQLMFARRSMEWTAPNTFRLADRLPLLASCGCSEPGREALLVFMSKVPDEPRKRIQSCGWLSLTDEELVNVDATYKPPSSASAAGGETSAHVQRVEAALAELQWHKYHYRGIYDSDWENGEEIAAFEGGYLIRSYSKQKGKDGAWSETVGAETYCRTVLDVWNRIVTGNYEIFHILFRFDMELSAGLLEIWRREEGHTVPGVYLGMLRQPDGEFLEGEFWLERAEGGRATLHWMDFPDDAVIDGQWECDSLEQVEAFLVDRGADQAELQSRLQRAQENSIAQEGGA